MNDHPQLWKSPQTGALVLKRRSPKKYGVAVALAGVFGMLGVHHFYLGRWDQGILDVGLTVAWVYCIAINMPLLAAAFFLADFGHTLAVTIMLLIGKFRDGEGRYVCYPGQNLEEG
jgi:hypothetical protein